MKRLRILFTPLLLLATPVIACPGTFIRDSQSWDNRGPTGEIEKIESVVPKGTKDEIVGYVIVGGKTYYVQLRAYLHDPADVRLQPGCKLERYE